MTSRALAIGVALLGGSGCGAGDAPRDMAAADLAVVSVEGDLGATPMDLARGLDVGIAPDLLPLRDPYAPQFRPPFTVPLGKGASPFFLADGDINGDGRPDLAVVDQAAADIAILLGRGDGTFEPVRKVPTLPDVSPRALAFADFDADGRLDFVFSHGGGVTVALGDGMGGFTVGRAWSAGTRTRAVAAADFDGDGATDALVVNYGSDDGHLFRGDGKGHLLGPGLPFATGALPYGIAVADVDGDGLLDAAVGCGNDGRGGRTGAVALLLGASTPGAARFLPATFHPVGGSPLFGVALPDLDGDGRRDLVVANASSNDVSVLRGLGKGGFAPQVVTAAVGQQPDALAVADLDLDGRLDVVTANTRGNDITLLHGDGRGGFRARDAYPVAGSPVAVIAVDLDGDRKPDVVTADASADDVTVLLNMR